MSTDTDMECTGRTTRMVAEAVAAAASYGAVYIVAAHEADARRIAAMVHESATRARYTPVRTVGAEVRWSDGRVRVVTLDHRLLDTGGPEWRITGTHVPVFVDHYAGDVWSAFRHPRPVAP